MRKIILSLKTLFTNLIVNGDTAKLSTKNSNDELKVKIDEETFAWIFLAIGTGSKDKEIRYKEVKEVADGIYHAIPTEREMQYSLKFLSSKNLIIKQSQKYRLSEKGMKIYNDSEKSKSLIERLRVIKEAFIKL